MNQQNDLGMDFKLGIPHSSDRLFIKFAVAYF